MPFKGHTFHKNFKTKVLKHIKSIRSPGVEATRTPFPNIKMGITVSTSACSSITLLWFLCISGQTIQGIVLKLYWLIHCDTFRTCWSCYSSAKFVSFPCVWLVKRYLHTYREAADRILVKCNGTTHYQPSSPWGIIDRAMMNSTISWTLAWGTVSAHWQANNSSDWASIWSAKIWLTFGHAPTRPRRLRAFDLLISFLGYADKPLIKSIPKLVGQLITWLSDLVNFWKWSWYDESQLWPPTKQQTLTPTTPPLQLPPHTHTHTSTTPPNTYHQHQLTHATYTIGACIKWCLVL